MSGQDDRVFTGDARDIRVTVQELAACFDLSDERVRQMIAQGILEREDDGRIGLQKAIINYERVLRSGTHW